MSTELTKPSEKINKLNAHVVISRFEEDLSWVQNIEFNNIIIYEKDKNTKYSTPNVGNEASSYLKYIIDHYENLPDYTIFLHCHEFSWHHEGSIIDIVNKFKDSQLNYVNLNTHIILPCPDVRISDGHLDFCSDNFSIFYQQYIKPATGKHIINPGFPYEVLGCAQFIVHKNAILKHTKQFYSNLYDWITTTKVITYLSARYLEWSWDLLWRKCFENFAVKIYENEEITSAYCNSINITNEIKDEIKKNEFYKVEDSITIEISNSKSIKKINSGYIYYKYL